ncbi:hypothetical protein D3C75_136410 [compost metagenome]
MCDFDEQVQSDELMGSFGEVDIPLSVKILLTPKRMISAVFDGEQMVTCVGVTAKVEPIELDQLKVTLCRGTVLFFDRNAPQVEFKEDDEDGSF